MQDDQFFNHYSYRNLNLVFILHRIILILGIFFAVDRHFYIIAKDPDILPPVFEKLAERLHPACEQALEIPDE